MGRGDCLKTGVLFFLSLLSPFCLCSPSPSQGSPIVELSLSSQAEWSAAVQRMSQPQQLFSPLEKYKSCLARVIDFLPRDCVIDDLNQQTVALALIICDMDRIGRPYLRKEIQGSHAAAHDDEFSLAAIERAALSLQEKKEAHGSCTERGIEEGGGGSKAEDSLCLKERSVEVEEATKALENKINAIARNLNDDGYMSFVNYRTHLDNLCFYTQAAEWQHRTEGLVNRLSFAAMGMMDSLDEFREGHRRLLENNEEMLQRQEETVESSQKVAAAVETARQSVNGKLEEMGEAARASAERVESFFERLTDIWARVETLHSLFLGDWFGLQSAMTYLLYCALFFVLTVFESTRRARAPLLLMTVGACALESVVIAAAVQGGLDFGIAALSSSASSPADGVDLLALVHRCQGWWRRGLLLVASGVLQWHFWFFVDPQRRTEMKVDEVLDRVKGVEEKVKVDGGVHHRGSGSGRANRSAELCWEEEEEEEVGGTPESGRERDLLHRVGEWFRAFGSSRVRGNGNGRRRGSESNVVVGIWSLLKSGRCKASCDSDESDSDFCPSEFLEGDGETRGQGNEGGVEATGDGSPAHLFSSVLSARGARGRRAVPPPPVSISNGSRGGVPSSSSSSCLHSFLVPRRNPERKARGTSFDPLCENCWEGRCAPLPLPRTSVHHGGTGVVAPRTGGGTARRFFARSGNNQAGGSGNLLETPFTAATSSSGGATGREGGRQSWWSSLSFSSSSLPPASASASRSPAGRAKSPCPPMQGGRRQNRGDERGAEEEGTGCNSDRSKSCAERKFNEVLWLETPEAFERLLVSRLAFHGKESSS
uniref:Uncharacterized protein n=1 Tax=Chromera velia CCMP2878 TaxID=1169474 RepID=A0A0G4HYK6_9ALVE|eukprot:Cvel_1546.t1-p1 / transcript=Cvel_1546.t1 / gene=Cvel_1546 / organism=Chromera_velia_CCMP2878 / gene_product=hypothetical protein / transcript_product=hypothetical protein / location=Cvel_scaffold54:127977-131828(-) / protein_length=824 / sequence_SO=supercontig / SO=protein_coding / is_pseudo=false